MNWAAYIESDPVVMEGRPVLRESHVPVDFLLGLLASGWSEADVLTNYPHLTPNHLRAVFAFAAESVRAMGHLCQPGRRAADSPASANDTPPAATPPRSENSGQSPGHLRARGGGEPVAGQPRRRTPPDP